MNSALPKMPCGVEHPDADIIFAWENRKAAFAAYNDLPHCDEPPNEYTPEERAHLGIVDDCEEIIRSTKASTPRGMEIKLWVSLCHDILDRAEETAANNADIDWYADKEGELDWPRRVILSAIRSLRAMADAEREFAEAWLKLWTDKGGSVFLEPTGKAQIGFPTYELSSTYATLAHRREGPGADRNDCWDDGHYYGTMNALHAALAANPGGPAIVKSYLRSRGLNSFMRGQGAAK